MQGLLPETPWQLDLYFNEERFYIWADPISEKTKKYMLKIESCNLFVPMAQLNIDILRIINTKMKNKNDAIYNFRDLRCANHPIASGQNHYESPDLTSKGQMALKIYVAFVLQTAYDGCQVL